MSEQTLPWEPSYGFMKTDRVVLAAALEMVRRRNCAYGPTSSTCDCKYGIGKHITPAGEMYDTKVWNSEMTGCPELRSVIHMLLHGEPLEADLEDGLWVRLTQRSPSE